MSLTNFVTKTINFAKKVGVDVKQLRTWIGLLPYLTTTNKSNLVEAINEVNSKTNIFPQVKQLRTYYLKTASYNTERKLRLYLDSGFAGTIKLEITGGWNAGNTNGEIVIQGGVGVNAGSFLWSSQLNCTNSRGYIRSWIYIKPVVLFDSANGKAYIEINKKISADNDYAIKLTLFSHGIDLTNVNAYLVDMGSSNIDHETNDVYFEGKISAYGGDSDQWNSAFQQIGSKVNNWDVASAIGFISSNVANPYFYHSTSGSFVELATKDWTMINFVQQFQLGNFFEKASIASSFNINHHDLGLFTVVPSTLNLPEAAYGIIYCYKANTTWWFQQFKTTNGTIWERRAVNPANIDDWQPWIKTNANSSIDNYAEITYVNQQIASVQSPYKAESNNIKTVGNSWVTYIGGRFNQALGDKITIKGNNLNYIGFNHVGSGALHAVLGNYNVSNGVLNNIVGNYSSANSNLINLIGNYLYSKQEGQSVYGNYNKITVPSSIPSKKVIHAFASGKSEYERDNAVEIFADNSTSFRGRAYYNAGTRNEEWFEDGTTLIDVFYLNSRINGDLQTDANSYDVCANNVLVVGVRKNTQTATDSEFQRINNENCFGVYGIAKGQYDVDVDTSTMYYKDSFYIGASATAALASVVDKKPYLVVILDPKTMQFDSIQYLDIVTIMQNKQMGFVQIVLGSFVNHNADIYFEFNQQILI